MKKLLILILIALILALSIFIVMNGLTIGKINILGINGIRDKNAQLDKQVEQASRLAEQDYKQAVNEVESNVQELQNKKQEYQDMTAVSTEGDIQAANQIQRYTIDTLRVKLGNYATQEGTTLRMDVLKGTNTTEETYNLRLTVNGSYVGITDFVSDIENDSILGFKIENFKMQPGSNTSDLQATFMCNDIAITGVSGTSPQTTQNTNTNNTNTNNTNTNNTNTNSTTNNTNTANNTNNTNTTNTAN